MERETVLIQMQAEALGAGGGVVEHRQDRTVANLFRPHPGRHTPRLVAANRDRASIGITFPIELHRLLAPRRLLFSRGRTWHKVPIAIDHQEAVGGPRRLESSRISRRWICRRDGCRRVRRSGRWSAAHTRIHRTLDTPPVAIQ